MRVCDIMTFTWSCTGLTEKTAKSARFELDLPMGQHTCRLKATDFYGAYWWQDIAIQVNAEPNNVPVASWTGSKDYTTRPTRKTLVTLNGGGDDADADVFGLVKE